MRLTENVANTPNVASYFSRKASTIGTTGTNYILLDIEEGLMFFWMRGFHGKPVPSTQVATTTL
jgi:hypothetical protein